MTPPPPPAPAAFDELAHVLLDVVPTGVILLRPVFAADGATIVDATYEYLNPAAQRQMQQPARPAESLLALFPGRADMLDFYRQAFLSGERTQYAGTYQLGGLAATFYLVAQRQGPRLVVSITGVAEQPLAAEAPGAAELAALLAAQQQLEVNRWFDQAPVAIALLRGPAHVVELMNEANAALLGSAPAQLLGRPILEAVPALQGQGFDLVLQRVLQGETIVFKEILVLLDRTHLGQPNRGYFHVTYQPWRSAGGEILGVAAVAIEVTDQVLARQQLAQLNQQLEARVQERTQQVLAAQAETERQRGRLAQLIAEAPAAICVLSGPDFIYELVNPRYQALFASRPLAGLPTGGRARVRGPAHVACPARRIHYGLHPPRREPAGVRGPARRWRGGGALLYLYRAGPLQRARPD